LIFFIPGILLSFWVVLSAYLYWEPFVALLNNPTLSGPPVPPKMAPGLYFLVLVPCHNEEPNLKALAETFSRQDYSHDQFEVVIIADHCTDRTAEVARSLGMRVVERCDGPRSWRGAAVNDVLSTHLINETFDGLVLLDVDAQVEPDFLTRVERYLIAGIPALQCATRTKNPTESSLSQVGDLIQVLIRNHQRGLSLRGNAPFIIGSHGVVLSRKTLDLLEWRTNTDQLADDAELGFLCFLKGIPFSYAPDIAVANEVVPGAQILQRQRRRWSQSSLNLIPRYAWPLFLRALRGDQGAWAMLFGVLLIPAFSTLLFLSAGLSLLFGFLGFWYGPFFVLASVTLLVTGAHVVYLLWSLSRGGRSLRARDVRGLVIYCGVRFISLLQAPFAVKSNRFTPASHVKENP
jgi:cellulose synthase/poly-beta-1,6-N-acetylglucosamine synthase-like glycosyltransferase